MNHIYGVVVSVLALSVINRVFEPRSGQTSGYKIDICSFFAMHATAKRKNKGWLNRNSDYVSKWSDVSTRDCCFSELTLYKSNQACWSSKRGHASASHRMYLVLVMIWLKILLVRR